MLRSLGIYLCWRMEIIFGAGGTRGILFINSYRYIFPLMEFLTVMRTVVNTLYDRTDCSGYSPAN